MPGRRIDTRASGRATLARQLLLEPSPMPVQDAVEQLAGLQAQLHHPPYLALAARVEGFALALLTDAITEGRVVRSTLMRGTLHLVTDRMFRWLRPTTQPAIDRVFRSAFAKRCSSVDLDEVLATADGLLAAEPHSHSGLRAAFAERCPDADAQALAYAVQYLRPLRQLPPAGLWGRGGRVLSVLGELDAADPARLVRTHLAAFGPASVRDVEAWSGLRGLDEVVEDMGGEVVACVGEDGQELLDLPDAVRPDPDTPAPVRLLPEFDSVVVAFADRTRLMSDEVRERVCVGSSIAATVLVDGRVDGMWGWPRKAGDRLEITPFGRWTARVRDQVLEEANRLLALDGRDPDATIRPPD